MATFGLVFAKKMLGLNLKIVNIKTARANKVLKSRKELHNIAIDKCLIKLATISMNETKKNGYLFAHISFVNAVPGSINLMVILKNLFSSQKFSIN